MVLVEYSKRRYDAAIREIERLKESEFPYLHIRAALLKLEDEFRKQRADLDKITPTVTPLVAQKRCRESLRLLVHYTPYLGFVLRSTNVRNAFETYPPVLRLARQLLGPDTKLLLSSEWDYSPFVYLPTAELPDFVLIGVPAYESSNPLLIALAGHELGHNIWNQQSLGIKFDVALRDAVLHALQTTYWNDYLQLYPNTSQSDLQTNIFVRPTWMPAHLFAKRQLEEVFCDVMGLRLFSEAYLHAFAYLLSPCLPWERASNYPTLQTRIGYLLDAANQFGVLIPDQYAALFGPEVGPSNPIVKLLVSAADAAVATMVAQVITEAKNQADAKSAPQRSTEEVVRIAADFSMVIPSSGNATLTDIVNAGWQCFHDGTLWNNVPHLKHEDRTHVLYDLVLKSLEISEYTERVGAP